LITDRPHRKASSPTDALKLMREEAKGGFFNYDLFEQFEEIIIAMKGVSNQERDHLLFS